MNEHKGMVLVATKENTVNLIPILHFQPDHVLILVTEKADKRNWATGLKAFLTNMIDVHERILDYSKFKDPNEWSAFLEDCDEIYFNIGGGQKNHVLELTNRARWIAQNYKESKMVKLCYADPSDKKIKTYDFDEEFTIQNGPDLSIEITDVTIENILTSYRFKWLYNDAKFKAGWYDEPPKYQDLYHIKAFRQLAYIMDSLFIEAIDPPNEDNLEIRLKKHLKSWLMSCTSAIQKGESRLNSSHHSNRYKQSIQTYLKYVFKDSIFSKPLNDPSNTFNEFIRSENKLPNSINIGNVINEVSISHAKKQHLRLNYPSISARDIFQCLVPHDSNLKTKSLYFEYIINRDIYNHVMRDTSPGNVLDCKFDMTISSIEKKNKDKEAQYDAIILSNKLQLLIVDAKTHNINDKDIDARLFTQRAAFGAYTEFVFVLPLDPRDLDIQESKIASVVNERIQAIKGYMDNGLHIYIYAPEFEKLKADTSESKKGYEIEIYCGKKDSKLIPKYSLIKDDQYSELYIENLPTFGKLLEKIDEL